MSEPIHTPETPPTPAPAPSAAPHVSTGASDSRRKSPFLACALSLMPGLGQVYVGYYQRGFLHAAVVAILITILATGNVLPLAPMLGMFLGFFWLYNMIDAGRRAALYNEVLAGRTDIELPQDFETPGLGGSVAGGVSIAAVGFVLLLHTRFEMPLDWMEEWWPMALIVFGVYLVYRAKRDQSAAVTPSYVESFEEESEE